MINTQSDTNERQKTKISFPLRICQLENARQLPMTKILLEVLMVFSVWFRRWNKRYMKEVVGVARVRCLLARHTNSSGIASLL